MSRSKVLSLRDLAGRAEDGEIPTLAEARMMEDHEVVSRLTEVRGIGRWTAEMFLIFRLGRPDVLTARHSVETLPNRRELVPVACRRALHQLASHGSSAWTPFTPLPWVCATGRLSAGWVPPR